MPTRTLPGVELTDTELVIDGCAFGFGPMYGNSTPDCLFIIKPAPLLRKYLELMADTRGGRIIELGIAQGGSAAAAALVARPIRLVAIDIGEPIEALTTFIHTHHLDDVLRPHYRTDQSNRQALNRIARAELATHDMAAPAVSRGGHNPRITPRTPPLRGSRYGSGRTRCSGVHEAGCYARLISIRGTR